jgi:hypothetical protein
LVSRAQLVIIEGITMPAAPIVAALPMNLRLEILDFFILVGFYRF